MKKALVLLVGLLLLPAVLAGCKLGKAEDSSAASAEPTPTITVTAAPSAEVIVDVAKQATGQQGFDTAKIKANQEVDQNLAGKIPGGSGVFSKTKLTSPTAVAAFMASNSAPAQKARAEAIQQTGATEAQLADPANWVAITTGERVVWKGNTYFAGGKQLGAPARVDAAGSAVMVFVPPNQVAQGKVTSVFFIRGACGNPQTEPPKPAPEPEPEPKGKAPLSWDCQQNWTPGCPGSGKWRQPPQDNDTSGANTGDTPGAPSSPYRPPNGPKPQPGKQPPSNNGGGYNSGGGTGSAPGGSTTDNGGTQGGGAVKPPNPPANSGQGGNNNSDTGGFN